MLHPRDLPVQREREHGLGDRATAQFGLQRGERAGGVARPVHGEQAPRGGDGEQHPVLGEVRQRVQPHQHVQVLGAGPAQGVRSADHRALLGGGPPGAHGGDPEARRGVGGLRGGEEPGGRGAVAATAFEAQRPRQLQPHPVELVHQPVHDRTGLFRDGHGTLRHLVGQLVRTQFDQHEHQPVEAVGQVARPAVRVLARIRTGRRQVRQDREGGRGVAERVLRVAEHGGAQRAQRGGLAEAARVGVELGELDELLQQGLDVVGVGLVLAEEPDHEAHPQQLGDQRGRAPAARLRQHRVQPAAGGGLARPVGTLLEAHLGERPGDDLLLGEVRGVLRAPALRRPAQEGALGGCARRCHRSLPATSGARNRGMAEGSGER
ncbi:hypothetical protein GCM10009559_60330 [Pseudonocardia zijingensis]|uniref:Uncharacterized protein n=1 Tax=Pseudonocardia zijingensis TaxID=153376 RepID=A0ABP3YPD8_9PSEU